MSWQQHWDLSAGVLRTPPWAGHLERRPCFSLVPFLGHPPNCWLELTFCVHRPCKGGGGEMC